MLEVDIGELFVLRRDEVMANALHLLHIDRGEVFEIHSGEMMANALHLLHVDSGEIFEVHCDDSQERVFPKEQVLCSTTLKKGAGSRHLP